MAKKHKSKKTLFKERWGIPMKKKFNGKLFTISAATKFGVPKYDAQFNQRYLTSMGFYTRMVQFSYKPKGNYYVYARRDY